MIILFAFHFFWTARQFCKIFPRFFTGSSWFRHLESSASSVTSKGQIFFGWCMSAVFSTGPSAELRETSLVTSITWETSIYYYPWSPIFELLLILEEPYSLTVSSLEELSGDLFNSFKIQVGHDCIPVYLLTQRAAGPRPVITHAGHADRRCCSPYPDCTPRFPSCGNQGRGEEEEGKVGVHLGLTPYDHGMQLDLAHAKHCHHADVACVNQSILVLLWERSYSFVRRDLSAEAVLTFFHYSMFIYLLMLLFQSFC